ncbi:MAG: precorrin-6A/cobalt-precorrin-6A reductase, partial [Eubacterium sp.]
MILVLGGTYDSRMLTEALLEQGRAVLYSSVTAYNTASLPESPLLMLNIGALEKGDMENLMGEKGVTLCVDATHPYAKEVSINAIAVCQSVGIPYVRLERPRLKDDGKSILGFP